METNEINKNITVEDIVNRLTETNENINAYVHNTSIEIRRIKQKGMQTYRFYGGEEAKQDNEYCNFYTNVLMELTKNNRTLRQIYNIPKFK